MQSDISRIDPADVLELRLVHGGDSAEEGADLALRKQGEGAEEAIRVTDVDRDGRRVRARLAGLPISDGVWDVLSIDSLGRATPVSTRDPGLSLDNRIAYLRGPRKRELRAVRDPRGRLRLSSAGVVPYAEVGWVEVAAEAVTVSGVLAYVPEYRSAATPQMVARQRGLDGVLTAPAELDGDRFHCAIPLGPVTRAHEPARGNNEWDLWLRLPDEEVELRLASHADDVVGKKHKVVYPGVDLGGRDGDGGETVVRVRPYHTAKDELSLLAHVRDVGT